MFQKFHLTAHNILFIYLFIYLFICLFVCLFVYLFIYLFIFFLLNHINKNTKLYKHE